MLCMKNLDLKCQLGPTQLRYKWSRISYSLWLNCHSDSTVPLLRRIHCLSFINQGQRKKKLEARAIREAKEEEQRKAVDLEHEQYQSKLRKEAIEKAKTQQYYQTDRVKGFHVSQSIKQACMCLCRTCRYTIEIRMIFNGTSLEPLTKKVFKKRCEILQSALLLTEVLKEREAQMELKKLKEQAMIGQVKL